MGRPITEADLVESYWWWRHCRLAAPHVILMTMENPNYQEWRNWKNGMEQIAQEWELLRRFRPDLKWPQFFDLNGFIAENLRARLVKYRFQSARKITTEISPVGWTDPDPDGWRWNLGCTRDALRRQYAMRFLPSESEIAEVFAGSTTADSLINRLSERRKQSASIAKFLRWIDSQAKKRGIKLPRGLSGQRNRSISWAWIEVLDVAQHVATRDNKLRKLSPAERKMKTMAKNAAKRLLPRYITALAEIHAIPGYPWGETPESMSRQRRIILGQWTPKTN